MYASHRISAASVVVLVLLFIFSAQNVLAQSDGTMPPADASGTGAQGGVAQGSAATPADATPVDTVKNPGIPADAAVATPVTSSSQPVSGPAVAPATASVPSAEVSPSAPVPVVINLGTTTIVGTVADTATSATSGWLTWALLGIAALLPFGYVVARLLQKKPTQSSKSDEPGGQCFDLKELMEEKLKELTDVRGIIEGKVKDAAKAELRESLTGTAAGDLIARADALEKEYSRIKKLFEQCQWEHSSASLRGTVIESSLVNTELLKKIKITDTRLADEWTLHDVEVSPKEIAELQKRMADGPWYMHFWEPGSNTVKVVFKDALYDVQMNDRSTWQEALQHGIARGIPEEQLDFVVGESH